MSPTFKLLTSAIFSRGATAELPPAEALPSWLSAEREDSCSPARRRRKLRFSVKALHHLLGFGGFWIFFAFERLFEEGPAVLILEGREKPGRLVEVALQLR